MMKRSIGSGLHAISHMYHHRHHDVYEIGNKGNSTHGDHCSVHLVIPSTHLASENVPANLHRLVFSVPMTSSSQIVLLQVITHMESFVHYEGIFRKSGSKHRVDQLVQELGEKDFEQILLSETYKPHDYASMLKHYFTELPEPLLLKRHLDAYMQTAGTVYIP